MSEIYKTLLYTTVYCKKCQQPFIVTETNKGHCTKCGKEVEGDEVQERGGF